MILQIIVTPKSFYSSSTDLTVRGWVYNMEDSTKTFKGHQHSVSMMLLEGDTCKLGHVCCQDTCVARLPSQVPRSQHTRLLTKIFTLLHARLSVTWLGPI